MEGDKECFESLFEKWNVFINFLRFEEPVGVFVPDGAVEGFDGFGEAVTCHVLFDLF